ncbi:hypothetical protein DJ021_13875 [Phenylobacterium hankyongense]|uniref:histidine kinase n=1 Tax=Phenylobacterium hankyongense TaxID=1813876 RepID=A0A328B1P6_9CAUL|nr:HWE histidine kinase domain-containing protein [Phenylobacterium hankyongense]RAK60819.1 hypothetical protein DJ021_13875 [Phenylobacterium hankyongense]
MATYHPHVTQGLAGRLRRTPDGLVGRVRRALRPSSLVEGAAGLLPRQWAYWHAIQFGVALTLLPTLLIAPIGALAGDEYPYLTYFPAVVIAAGFAGWAAGAASLTAAAILVWRISAGVNVLGPFLISAAVAGAAAAMMNTAVRHLALQKMATEAANRSLRASEEHNRRFLELSPQIPWTAAPSGLLTDIPERLARLTGVERTQLLGDGWAAVVHPDDLPAMRSAWANTVATGDSFDFEYRFRLADGAYHWLRSRAYPYRDPTGEIIAWYGLSEDVQSRKQAEEDRELLTREVDHRARNLLSVVQSIARLMPKDHPEVFVETFLGRLSALAAAHGLLAEGRWTGVPIRDLLEKELLPFAGRSGSGIRLAGERLCLRPNWVQALGMVLHELATNSAKYGALSTAEGRLTVSWRLQHAGSRLRLEWLEENGPPVRAPQRRGFGSTLIERNLRLAKNAEVTFDWRREGLRLVVVMDARDVLQHADEAEPTSDVPVVAAAAARLVRGGAGPGVEAADRDPKFAGRERASRPDPGLSHIAPEAAPPRAPGAGERRPG